MAMRLRNFDEDGFWLKGNIHSHSTASDGDLPPETMLQSFARRGYGFMSVTDHNHYVDYSDWKIGDMVIIPGFELSGMLGGKPVHLNFIQQGTDSPFESGTHFKMGTTEETVAFCRKYQDQFLIILNHPDWSLLEFQDIADVDFLTGVEIYNWGTELGENMGESVHFWESGLRRGWRWKGLATDDNHHGYTEQEGWPFDCWYIDAYGGWINVKVRDKSQKAIIEAIQNGNFYASSGPEIYDFYVEDNAVHITCSPVDRIIIKGEHRNIRRAIGPGLTNAVIELRDNKEYVRAECIDANGKVAWTNPIYLV